MKSYQKNLRLAAHILTGLYFIACIWLYYQQSVAILDESLPSIPYQSDLPLHISMVIEDGWYYSFTAYAYQLLYWACGGNTIGIAVFLAAVTAATVYVTELLVCRLWKRAADGVTLMLSLSLNFVMPVYLSFVGEFRYVSYQSGNIWHNSTYLCMRLMALLTLLYYFKLEETYRQGISVREWATFALLNILCTGIKPSFLLVYSPIVGVFLVADVIHKTPWRRVIAFGSALLPSGLVLLWQNQVLFGEDTGNGITFQPWYTFSLHASIVKGAAVCSVLFCALVVCVKVRELIRERSSVFILLMSVLGFLEAVCLVESGSRSVDGNFLWGYSFCIFVLFALCAVKWLQMGKGRTRGMGKLLLSAVYAWHLYCGLYFFISLVTGASYWMR
ncbi:MAG: hypothetical protein LUH19_04435 [Lachnospiraceae bacterium]|nr:hypothetical protein [Lachnospiraceae bacterium]